MLDRVVPENSGVVMFFTIKDTLDAASQSLRIFRRYENADSLVDDVFRTAAPWGNNGSATGDCFHEDQTETFLTAGQHEKLALLHMPDQIGCRLGPSKFNSIAKIKVRSHLSNPFVLFSVCGIKTFSNKYQLFLTSAIRQ